MSAWIRWVYLTANFHVTPCFATSHCIFNILISPCITSSQVYPKFFVVILSTSVSLPFPCASLPNCLCLFFSPMSYYNLPTLLYPTVFVHSSPPMSFYYNLPTLLTQLSLSTLLPLCPSTTISLRFFTQLSLSTLLPLCPSTISLRFFTQLSLSTLLPLCPSTISLRFFTQLSLSTLLPLCPTISLRFFTQLSLSTLLPLCPSTISLRFFTQLSLSTLLPLCPSTISLRFFTQLSLSTLSTCPNHLMLPLCMKFPMLTNPQVISQLVRRLSNLQCHITHQSYHHVLFFSVTLPFLSLLRTHYIREQQF